MGILTLAEDRPTPKSVYNWRIYVLAIIASCGSNMIGYTSAFIGTTITLSSFEREFGFDHMSSEHVSTIDENIVSFFIAGAFFAALGTYALGHFLGRKWSLVIASAVFTLGGGLQLGTKGSTGLGIMYAGRVLSGVGTGIASNIIPIYISELAPPAIRGRLVGLYELGWQIGGLVGFWINVSPFSDTDCRDIIIILTAYSTGLNNTCPHRMSNGLFPLPFRLFPRGYCSLARCGSGNHPAGFSSRTVGSRQ